MFNPQLDIAFFMSDLVKEARFHRINSQGAEKKE